MLHTLLVYKAFLRDVGGRFTAWDTLRDQLVSCDSLLVSTVMSESLGNPPHDCIGTLNTALHKLVPMDHGQRVALHDLGVMSAAWQVISLHL